VKVSDGLTGPVEDCLIAIATLRDDQIPSIPARIAERLEVSLPTAGETLKRLERDGYVLHEKGREYTLSPSGQAIADKLMRRHRLIERWLTDVLHLDWATAHAEAHKLEHGVSDLVAEELARSMGYPDSCPHGNPISQNHREGATEATTRLSQAERGAKVVLRRISEIAEDNTDLMSYYEREGLRPGAQIAVKGKPLNNALEIELEGRPLSMAAEIASFLWVTDRTETG
jgi:DtxR family transcriptional regulator, iron-dependent repressor